MSVKNLSAEPRWKHQSYEFRIGRDKRSRALIWPMRSGKSRAVTDVACYQFDHGRIEGVILIAPNGVHQNWARNEIPRWGWPKFSHPTFVWETPKRGYPEKVREWEQFLAANGLKWFCINMEALSHPDCVKAINQFLKTIHRQFMFAVSEAHHFGRPSAKRTHKARSLAYHASYVRTETGTPILTGPLRAFSQYELLAPGALGFRTLGQFEQRYADFLPEPPGPRRRKRVAQYKNIPELTARIAQWSSLVLRSELGDMPNLIRTERPVVMSEMQRQAYIQMVAQNLAEVEDGEVTVKDGGARMIKLQQILMGYVADTKRKMLLNVDKDAPIYDAIIEEVRGTLPGKALVWFRFKEDCRRLANRMRQWRMPVLEYWGDFSTDVREANRAKFLSAEDMSTMIGTPDCGGEGLDFSTADVVIFGSGNPNARMMAQAEERATVKGGKSVGIVRIRSYGTVDDRLWDIVDGNISLADTITGTGLRRMLAMTDV